MIRKLAETREVFAFVDIHGHSRKKNAFMYGVENKLHRLQECVLPRLLAQNAQIFAFEDCSYVVPKSKETTARVVAARELGIGSSYTLEASFCGANFGKYKDTHFSTRHYAQLGEAFCKTLCDLIDPGKVQSVWNELQAVARRDQGDEDEGSDWENDGDKAEVSNASAGKKKDNSKKKKAKDSKRDRKDAKKLSRGSKGVRSKAKESARLGSKVGGVMGEASEDSIPGATSRSRRMGSSRSARATAGPGCSLPKPTADYHPSLAEGFSETGSGRRGLRESLVSQGSRRVGKVQRGSCHNGTIGSSNVKIKSRDRDRWPEPLTGSGRSWGYLY
eukprot:TRINITY_DN5376_c0_g1_i2.p1 TRINITY_DN5376_c0_g1~~TRINITY_DN5376_c0_g1_i2.p1  ORF type:complete len:332 (+),score=77.78 TRINITY_DN5376_c0_g1_i2:306-1301(+)